MEKIDFKFRKYKKGDELELVRLFNTCFDKKIDVDYWNWKYRDNPYGFDIRLILNPNKKIIGQICGHFKKGIFKGKDCIVDTPFDVCLLPEYRGQGIYKKLFDLKPKKSKILILSNPQKKRINYYLNKDFQLFPSFKLTKKIGFFKRLIILRKKSNLTDNKILTFEDINKAKVDYFWKTKKKELDTCIVRDYNHLKWRFSFSQDNIVPMFFLNKNKVIGYFALKIIKNEIYLIDFLFLNKSIDYTILNEIDNICLKLGVNKIHFICSDNKNYDLFTKSGYKLIYKMPIVSSSIKGVFPSELYTTYADFDEL